VDAAESAEAEATIVNGDSVAAMAKEAVKLGSRMIGLSTDYVFSGTGSQPWTEDDAVAPLNAYGRSKLVGEQALKEVLPGQGCMVRTSWVYGRKGKNFVHTMLHLMRAGKSLQVIDDQQGCPTWAGGLAQALWALATSPREQPLPATLHFTDGGIISWFDFATAIREEALALGLDIATSSVSACTTEAYPTPARRPHWSPLQFSQEWAAHEIHQQPWRQVLHAALPLMMAEAKAKGSG